MKFLVAVLLAHQAVKHQSMMTTRERMSISRLRATLLLLQPVRDTTLSADSEMSLGAKRLKLRLLINFPLF
jgi:hypothetical protein